MIPGFDRIPGSGHTAAAETKQSSQHKVRSVSSFLSFKHCEEDTLLARIETVEGMVLSQLSLLDTCMCACALSSVLVIDMNWIAVRTPRQLARLARH